MEEIIAHRNKINKKALLGIFVISVLSLVLGIFYIFVIKYNLYSYPENKMWILKLICGGEFVIGTLGILIGILGYWRSKNSELIILNGSKLMFADGKTCNINEVKDVKYSISKWEKAGIGTLKIDLTDKTVKFKFVVEVAAAHKRLTELMFNSREKEN